MGGHPFVCGAAAGQVVEPEGALGNVVAPGQDGAQRGHLHPRHQPRRIVAADIGDGDERLGLENPEDVFELVLAILHGDRAEDRPDARAGEQHRGGLDDVRQLHGDDVVLADAAAQQAICDGVHVGVEFGEVQATRIAVGKGGAIGRVRDRLAVRHVGDRPAEQAVDGFMPPPTLGGESADLFLRRQDHLSLPSAALCGRFFASGIGRKTFIVQQIYPETASARHLIW